MVYAITGLPTTLAVEQPPWSRFSDPEQSLVVEKFDFDRSAAIDVKPTPPMRKQGGVGILMRALLLGDIMPISPCLTRPGTQCLALCDAHFAYL